MKALNRIFVTLLVISVMLMAVSCGGDSSGVENSPTVQNATKAFQIGAGTESYDTLKLAVQALQEKSIKAMEAGEKTAAESYTIRLNWDKTDAGATISGINAEVKLDFQGHVLTLEDGSEGIVISNTGKAVEITNGTVQVAEGAILKSGTTAVITASTDLTLSASINAINTATDAIATTGGIFSIQGEAQITARTNQKSINATESAVVKVNSSQVVLTGGMKLDGNADVDLGDATLRLTEDIEKGDACKLEVKAENIEPQNDNVHLDKIDEARHNHTFSEEWQKDEDSHWHVATCEHVTLKRDYGLHTWDDGIVTTEATHTADGVKTYTCTVCNDTKNEVIPADSDAHTFSDAWTYDSDYHWHDATCEHNSVISAKAEHSFSENVCVVCGFVYQEEPEKVMLIKETTSVSYDSNGKAQSCSTCTYNYLSVIDEHNFRCEPVSRHDWMPDNYGHYTRSSVTVSLYEVSSNESTEIAYDNHNVTIYEDEPQHDTETYSWETITYTTSNVQEHLSSYQITQSGPSTSNGTREATNETYEYYFNVNDLGTDSIGHKYSWEMTKLLHNGQEMTPWDTYTYWYDSDNRQIQSEYPNCRFYSHYFDAENSTASISSNGLEERSLDGFVTIYHSQVLGDYEILEDTADSFKVKYTILRYNYTNNVPELVGWFEYTEEMASYSLDL